jgi:hypothetical protein
MKVLILCFLLAAFSFSASVPCTQSQASSLGTASDCAIDRTGATTLTWGAKINFKAAVKWTAASYSNVLAYPSSPRVPIGPSKSQCKSAEGSYTAGQSVLITCSQAFDDIPVGYVNAVSAFDNTNSPLGFSLKIPLSMNLMQE